MRHISFGKSVTIEVVAARILETSDDPEICITDDQRKAKLKVSRANNNNDDDGRECDVIMYSKNV